MSTHALQPLLAALLSTLQPGCARCGAGDPGPLPYRTMGLLRLDGVPEPSGLVYHSGRGTLFVVDDGGVLCEFEPGGRVLRRERIRRADFEGITVDPETGLLYVAIEGDDSILEVDPSSFQAIREFPLPRVFEGRTVLENGGQGIEAVTVTPDGTFLVANQGTGPQDPGLVLEVSLPLGEHDAGPARILRAIDPGMNDLSALHFDVERDLILVVSDSENRLSALSRTGAPVRSWTLPGTDQEGIAVDANGVLYIAQDSGGVLRVEVDWPLAFGPPAAADSLNGGP